MPRRKLSAPPISLFSFQDIITSVTGIILLLTLLCTLALVGREKRTVPMRPSDVADRVRQSLDEVRRELASLQEELSQGDRLATELARLSLEEIKHESQIVGHELRRLQSELDRLQAEAERLNAEKTAWQAKRLDRDRDRRRLDNLKEQLTEVTEQIAAIRRSNQRFYRPDFTSSKNAWLVDISGKELLVARLGQPKPVLRFQDWSLSQRVTSFMEWTKAVNPATDYFVLAIRPSGIRAYDDVRDKLRAGGFDVGLDLFAEKEMLMAEEREPGG